MNATTELASVYYDQAWLPDIRAAHGSEYSARVRAQSERRAAELRRDGADECLARTMARYQLGQFSRAAIDAGRRAALAVAPATITLRHASGQSLTVSVDDDGCIAASGCEHTDADLAAALRVVPAFVAAAQAAREAFFRAMAEVAP